ncbi:hypothetical protein NE237_030977 [Protea cynaroides]|uniref:Uncharacterized protein n=1 Tax=Protea cynaroides TaxID=273540 RepID=A0A9Q0GX75_9MAGN|nr:hypothetical protein NE237_030977 [Protea cynaroides]
MCLVVVGLWFLWRRRKKRRKKKIFVKVAETNTVSVTCGELVDDQISFILSFLYSVAQLLVAVVASVLLRLRTDGMRSVEFSMAYGVGKLNAFILEEVMTFWMRHVDLETEGNPRPIFLSASLSSEEAEQYVQLLKEYLDIFAWSYVEITGLDPEIVVHRQHIKPDAKPFKQAQRRFHPLLMDGPDRTSSHRQ